ncbi:STAS domain-containing protein [Luteimonas rhizosphaerae]|uniref:STAS domain-containing protein n=1 Tax=Luteimonas sp. 4-12 TaxID=2027406 RepID=UPI000C7B277B|nr:STAS domain-containing protein [Luteimonas sp. 4-12]
MNTLDLGEDLGIEASAELHARLAPHLDDAVEIVLDGARVSRLHTAGVQVLCAFFASRRSSGRATSLQGCSDALRNAAALLGVGTSLGLTGDAPLISNASTVENPA